MTLTGPHTQTKFVVLAPSGYDIPEVFGNHNRDAREHARLMAELQRFRGRIYSADGAISPAELTEDGRHKSRADDQSWHILALNRRGRICATLRYLEETCASSFEDLWVRASARIDSGGDEFRRGVENEMSRARRLGMRFGEVGGWAVAEENRMSAEPLRILLAMYGLLEILGGCVGIATATVRHGSATILKRVGLANLSIDGQELKPYYDLHYQCHMELLRFDSRLPNPKYQGAIRSLMQTLTEAPVVAKTETRYDFRPVFHGFGETRHSASVSDLVPALQPV